MGRHGVTRGVRPRTVVIGMVAIVVIVAAAVGLSFLLKPRHPGAVDLRGPHGDAPFSLAGVFPAEGDEPLANPLGIAYDGEYLYVAESDAGMIQVFDLEGGRVDTIALPVAEGQRSVYPSSVVIAGERLAVVDNAANRVLVIPRRPAGDVEVDLVLGEAGEAPVQPTALTYAEGEFFVADGADGAIRVYDDAGQHLRSFDVREQHGLDGPLTALAISEGTLYAADYASGRVVAIDASTGDSDDREGPAYALPRTVEPLGDGVLVVVDGLGRAARLIDQQMNELASADADTVPEGPMSAPWGAAWASGDDRLYVTDSGTGRVLVYNLSLDQL